MTKLEYEKLYLSARNITQIEQRKTMIALRDVYRTAGQQVSEVVERAERLGLSQFTIDSQRQLQEQLAFSASEVSRAVEKEIPISVSRIYNRGYLSIDERYIMDVVKDAGAAGLITKSGIRNIGVGINDQLIRSLVVRIDQRGYSFSNKIWNDLRTSKAGNLIPDGIFGDFQYRLKNVISAGIAQGRDNLKIARDISVYIKDGKIQLINRYGKLERGTSEFTKRISNKIDSRALRLVRSEVNASLQDASIRQGALNPAVKDLYNWKKTPGNPIDQDPSRNASGFRCIDLEEFNPYTIDDVPSYQHPNCSCSVIPVLMDRRTFERDVRNWVNGQNVPYMDEWYNTVYLPSQR